MVGGRIRFFLDISGVVNLFILARESMRSVRKMMIIGSSIMMRITTPCLTITTPHLDWPMK